MGFGAPGGVKEFLKLEDTPTAYTDKAGNAPLVTVGEDALEFKPVDHYSFSSIFDGGVDSPATGYILPKGVMPYKVWDDTNKQYRLAEFFAVPVGEYIYFGGGECSGLVPRHFTKQFWRYKPATGEWTRLADLPQTATFGYDSAGYHDGKIYAHTAWYDEGYAGHLFIYTIATDSWQDIAGFANAYLGAATNVVLAACSDYLYVLVRTGGTAYSHQRFDYTAETWGGARATPAENCYLGGVIGDEFYIVADASPFRVYQHDKVADSWVDQAQNAPERLKYAGCNIEDADEWWRLLGTAGTTHLLYKYTPAGGWVLQKNLGVAPEYWEHFVQMVGETNGWLFYGAGEAGGAAWGDYSQYIDDGIWDLGSKAFVEGDMVVITPKGVPVVCSIEGSMRFITSAHYASILTEAATWDFSLDKTYDYYGVKIWAGVR